MIGVESSKGKIIGVPEYFDKTDSDFFIDYINRNIDKFTNYRIMSNPKRFALRFGKDQVFWDTSSHDLRLISDIEERVREVFDGVCRKAEEEYGLDKKLYVASFWLAKQYPGGFVMPHFDSQQEVNSHFEYSAVIYLNSMSSGGEIVFPELKYSYRPKGNDLVMFPSKGADLVHNVAEISEERFSLLFWLTHDDYFAV